MPNRRCPARYRAAAPAALLVAEQQRRQLHALAHEQRAHALGGVQLVAGQRQQIGGQLPQVDGELADRLHGIEMQRHVPVARDACRGLDREQHPGLVVGPQQRDQRRIRRDGRFDGGRVQPAMSIDRQDRETHPVRFQVAQQLERGRMLDRARDHVLAPWIARQCPEDREVVALGTTAGEHQLGRAPISSATWARASLTSRRACSPAACLLDGLPYSSQARRAWRPGTRWRPACWRCCRDRWSRSLPEYPSLILIQFTSKTASVAYSA